MAVVEIGDVVMYDMYTAVCISSLPRWYGGGGRDRGCLSPASRVILPRGSPKTGGTVVQYVHDNRASVPLPF